MDDPELAAIRARKLRELMAAAGPKPVAAAWAGPLRLTDATFDGEVGRAGLLLVDFWAEWCGPCRMIAPVLEQIAAESAGKLKIVKLNVDENPQTPPKFAIRGIPTLILFKDGQVAATQVGAVHKAQLSAFVKPHLAAAAA